MKHAEECMLIFTRYDCVEPVRCTGICLKPIGMHCAYFTSKRRKPPTKTYVDCGGVAPISPHHIIYRHHTDLKTKTTRAVMTGMSCTSQPLQTGYRRLAEFDVD